MVRSLFKTVARLCGICVTRIASERKTRLADLSHDLQQTVEWAQPYTMTSPERLSALCMAVEYVVANNIPGTFVECGVWRGGSSMAAAWTYSRLQRENIDIFLFDTFEGMSEPSKEDIHAASARPAEEMLAKSSQDAEVWAYAPLSDVMRNLERTGYPSHRVHFVKGKVEDTVPAQAPEQIAILRLDTDWYESTKHELIHLFPRLSRNGILIIDDYGAWTGARKAVDEYFAEMGMKPYLSRIDSTGRIYVKACL